MPTISIIIATFNAAGTLQRCLDSIRAQTAPDVELIVMDGGSSDGTVAMLESNADLISFWRSEPDKGIFNAWNKGLTHASGEWICFLGADDYLYEPRSLEKMLPHLEEADRRGISIVYSRLAVVSEAGEEKEVLGEDWSRLKKLFLHEMCLPHPGLMQHRRLFETHGNFDESFKLAGDYEFLLRELKSREALFVPDVITAAWTFGGVSSNPRNLDILFAEVKKARELNGVRSFPRLWSPLRRAHVRRWLMKLLSESQVKAIAKAYRKLVGKEKSAA